MDLSRRSFLVSSAWAAAGTAFAVHPPSLALRGEPAPIQRAAASRPILLGSNENAYGAPESARAAMRAALEHANRYPTEALNDGLKERLGRLHGVPRECVSLGCGSDELIRNAAGAFTGPVRPLVVPSPTYESIAHHAAGFGAEVLRIPLTPSFSHDLEGMLKAAKSGPGAGLVYLCNPNNPTASLTPRRDLEAFLAQLPYEIPVVMDEAYHHFVDSPDYVSFLDVPFQRERLIVLRTFSKIFGMAGLRVGYAISSPERARQIQGHEFMDNVNGAGIQAAMAALDDTRFLVPAAARNARDRTEFCAQAAARGLGFIPSQANFVMLETRRPVRSLNRYFEEAGIHIGRPFPPLENHARISLGTPEDMRAFWQAWDRLPVAG